MSGQLMYSNNQLEIIELNTDENKTSGLQLLYRSELDKNISNIVKGFKNKEIIHGSKNYGTEDAPVYGIAGSDRTDYFITRGGPKNTRDIFVRIIPEDNGVCVLCDNNIYSAVAFSKEENVKKAAEAIAKEYGLIVKECEYGKNVFATENTTPIENLEKSIYNVFNAQNELIETILKV